MSTPKCPHCNVRGIDSLAVEDMRMFLFVYCHKCDAIYSVVPSPPNLLRLIVKPSPQTIARF